MAAYWRNLSGTLFNLLNLSQASSGRLCQTLPFQNLSELTKCLDVAEVFQAPRTPESLNETGFEPDFF